MSGAQAAEHHAAQITFWNEHAGGKWVRRQAHMDAMLDEIGQRAMGRLDLSPGLRVLDVGCGCGTTSFELARRVGPSGTVLGVDVSAPMLSKAKEDLAAGPAKNITFEHGDAATFDFPKEHFDRLFSRFGVMFFGDPEAAFQNLFKALRPGARIAFACWRGRPENPWIAVPAKAAAKHVELPPRPGPEDPGQFSFGDAERIRRILSRAWFDNIIVDSLDLPLTLGRTLADAAEFSTNMGPIGAVIAEAGDAVAAKVVADLEKALAPYETEVGVQLPSAAWIVTAQRP